MDYKFIPTSTMGIMAREYEQSQFTQILQTVPPESPVYMKILEAIFDNSSFSNRDILVASLQQMQQQQQNKQPDPSAMGQVQAQHDQNQIRATEVQLNDMNKKAEIAIKQQEVQLKAEELNLRKIEIGLKDKELDHGNLKAQAETALKELAIHLEATLADKKQSIDALNNAQDNATNAMATRLGKVEQIIATPVKPVRKTFKIKSPVTGKVYEGEITPH